MALDYHLPAVVVASSHPNLANHHSPAVADYHHPGYHHYPSPNHHYYSPDHISQDHYHSPHYCHSSNR